MNQRVMICKRTLTDYLQVLGGVTLRIYNQRKQNLSDLFSDEKVENALSSL